MAFDDDKPHDWDPEKEKRSTDPKELAREFVRAAAEEQAKIDKEAASGRGPRAVRSYCPPAPVLDLQIGIHKIENGHLVLWGLAPVGYPADRSRTKEVYATTPEAARAFVAELLVDFFAGKLEGDPVGPFSVPQGPILGGEA